jgi:hypothetical protein
MARHMRLREERADGIVRAGREFDLRHVADNEARGGNVAPRELDLASRDVDADDVRARRQDPRDRNTVAAAEVEHVSARRNEPGQARQIPLANLCAGGPFGIAFGDAT